jgi:4-diphosphocytidyl-2-C-methyl-D-erythritol kinase
MKDMMQEYKAHAKVNIFLKITGTRGQYHEIISRFMVVENLFDRLVFEKKEIPNSKFEIAGEFTCSIEDNTIYKAYVALQQHTHSKELEEFFYNYRLRVVKKIPAFAGLGGGSSDAATFLDMCNDQLSLGLQTQTLATIGLRVGADVPFFVYGYKSANVSGIGEIVEAFDEDLLEIETFTPNIEISTPRVYGVYREHFFHPLMPNEVTKFQNITSKEVLTTMDAKEANDLFAPALQAYETLEKHYKKGYFFSGSGSSFFRMKGDKNG